MSNPPPTELNGYPIIGSMARFDGRDGSYVVIAYRKGHEIHEYVTAVWHPNCGDSWIWGHYLGSLDDAKQDMIERAH